ncbi:MAG: ABC transporter permease DevC [Thermosynechococcaceae cyanobacterium]
MFKRGIPLAWLQLSRERSRLLVAIAGISFADFLMFMQLGFQAALYDSTTLLHKSLEADVIIMSPQAQSISSMGSFPRRRLTQATSVEGVSSAEALYVDRANWKNPETRQETEVMFIGFNTSKPIFKLPEIKDNLAKIKLTDSVLFDRGSEGDYEKVLAELEQGKVLTTEVGKRRIRIEGLFTLGASFSADANAVTSDLTFWRLFPNQSVSEVNVGLVKLKPGANAQSTVKQLQRLLPNDVKVLTLDDFITFETNYWATTTPIGFIFTLGTAIGFIVGLVIVYQILYSDVSDHLAEYATLKAMGFRDNYFLVVVLQEAIILAAFGFVPGLGISLGLYHVAKEATMLPIIMTANRAYLVFILTGIMCTLSGAIALRKLRQADPAEIF